VKKKRKTTTGCAKNAEPISKLYLRGLGDVDRHTMWPLPGGGAGSSPAAAAAEATKDASICKNLALVASFEPRNFVPVWWGKNPHAMTIGGAGAFEGVLTDRAPAVEYRRVWLETPDGDNLAVDFLVMQLDRMGKHHQLNAELDWLF
jgi:hypothetical protein